MANHAEEVRKLSIKSGLIPATFCVALILSHFIWVSDSLAHEHNPPPTYEHPLLRYDISNLISGSVEPDGTTNWLWWEEIIRHGDETLVIDALKECENYGQGFLMEVNAALFILNDNPEERFNNHLDYIANGSEEEQRQATILLQAMLVRTASPQAIDINYLRERVIYIPILLNIINNEDPFVRSVVIGIIGHYPDVDGVIQTILDSAHDEHRDVRFYSTHDIGYIASINKGYFEGYAVIETLIDLLQDEHDNIVIQAIDSSSYFIDDEEIFKIIMDLFLISEAENIREKAFLTLTSTDSKELTVRMINLGLNDSNPSIKREAEIIQDRNRKIQYIHTAFVITVILIVLGIIIISHINRKSS